MKDLIDKLIFAATVIGLCLILVGCQAVKGAAHDTAWLFDQIDHNITQPE
jgi:hypothetical protein